MIKEFEEALKIGKAAINFKNKMVDIAAYRRAKVALERAKKFDLVKWIYFIKLKSKNIISLDCIEK